MFYADIFEEIPGYSCNPKDVCYGCDSNEVLGYEGKYDITLSEAKYSCSKDVNCAKFYSKEIAGTKMRRETYYKCTKDSDQPPDNSKGVLYVKGI